MAYIKKKISSHPHHLVSPSPWPLATSAVSLCAAFGVVSTIHQWLIGPFLLILSLILLSVVTYFWWRDVIIEAIRDHAHTGIVKHGLRMGMTVLILSELMFFVAFFWSFFKAWLDPVYLLENFNKIKEVGWPPEGIKTLNVWSIPFMNTIILLLSGCTVTWAHKSLLEGDKKSMLRMLGFTIILGLMFSIFQIIEYHHATFAFAETGDKAIYSSNFYMATGFHGFHVLVGTIFLAVCWVRAKKGQFSEEDHLGFEFAAWYWHFVDVVWIFLFIFVYYLSSR